MLRFLLSFPLAFAASPLVSLAEVPPLPEAVTSFGAAVAGDDLYVYGGHTGPAHEYSVEDQNGSFLRLNLADPATWEELPGGPKLQGLALVAHEGRVYRLGGFTATNAAGETHDLRSQESVASFDPQSGRWEDLTPLPEPRSSFDAAVLGDRVYVVGGWDLQGEQSGDWHSSAWSADLSKRPVTWERIADPPFERRALAVAAHEGKIYAIGGMTQDGPTRRVDVYDPAARSWSVGAELLGDEPIEGFGAAARSLTSGLYVSSLTGTVQRLSRDGSEWEEVATLEAPRFFHQMAPFRDGLLLVGGANMSDGKLPEPEAVVLTREAGAGGGR